MKLVQHLRVIGYENVTAYSLVGVYYDVTKATLTCHLWEHQLGSIVLL